MSLVRSGAFSLVTLAFAARLFSAEPAAPASAEAAPPPAPAPKAEATQLEERMEDMNTAFKRLRRQISDPAQNASSLAQVKKLRQNAELAAKLEPAKAKDLPAAERPKFVANYEAEMEKLIKALGDLEAALQKNDNAAAAEIVAKIGAHQKQAHKEFRRPQN